MTSSPVEVRYLIRRPVLRVRFAVPGIVGGARRDQRFRSFVRGLVAFGKLRLRKQHEGNVLLAVDCFARGPLPYAPTIWRKVCDVLADEGVIPLAMRFGAAKMGHCLVFAAPRERMVITIFYLQEDTKP